MIPDQLSIVAFFLKRIIKVPQKERQLTQVDKRTDSLAYSIWLYSNKKDHCNTHEEAQMANLMPQFAWCVTTQTLSGKHGISLAIGKSMRKWEKLLDHTACDVSPLQSDSLRCHCARVNRKSLQTNIIRASCS